MRLGFARSQAVPISGEIEEQEFRILCGGNFDAGFLADPCAVAAAQRAAVYAEASASYLQPRVPVCIDLMVDGLPGAEERGVHARVLVDPNRTVIAARRGNETELTLAFVVSEVLLLIARREIPRVRHNPNL